MAQSAPISAAVAAHAAPASAAQGATKRLIDEAANTSGTDPREGRKSRLMPTGSPHPMQVIGKDQAAPTAPVTKPSGDSDDDVSIWYILKDFMQREMNINGQDQQSATMQIQAQSTALSEANQSLANFNIHVSNETSFSWMQLIKSGGTVGVTALLLVGGLLTMNPILLGLGVAYAAGLIYVNTAKPSSGAFSSSSFLGNMFTMSDTTNTPSPGDSIKDQSTMMQINNSATQANQKMNTTMQIQIEQPSQLNQQFAQTFSSLINYAAQAAATARG